MSYAGYTVMNIDRLKALTVDRILIEWETDTNELAGGKLVRPETYKARHYTGIVVLMGPDVDPEISVGDRILFDQFCSPERFFDPEKNKRYAIIRERDQGTPFAIIPPRARVHNSEGDFDFDN